jgi:choline dehydrogenase-like flavoprotein
MHIDLDRQVAETTYRSAVCIIGGGIAGLSLATRLAGRGVDVHLLEAGGLHEEERSQGLYYTEMAAECHRGSNDGRFRTFGGSSTQWGGQILPFTDDVFSPKPGLPNLAWPITEDELTPYYDDVQSILGVDQLPFTEKLLPALGYATPKPSPDIRVRFSKWTPFSKRNLAQTVGAEALAHPRITVFTHANAACVVRDPTDPSRIGSVKVLSYDKREFTFTASHFIVCAGTVESCRLLLCSPDVPNPHDQIGRYFHDHVAYHAALFHSPARERIPEMTGPFYVGGTLHSCKFEASNELREREKLLCAMAHVVVIEPEDSGTAAIRNLLRSLQHGRVKEAITANLLPMLRGAGDVARLLYYSRFKKRRAISKRAVLRLNIDVEQAPNPDNRVMLSPTHTDALGLPVTIVDWRIGKIEQDTAGRFAHFVRAYLQSLGYDPQEWDHTLTDGAMPRMLDTNHAMGGLRMGDDPASSVVDRNLTVHGVKNLHIASCAVFPSGSSSNPTFTMMALTLRLADRLATQLSGSATSSTSDNRAESLTPPR